MFDLLIVVWPHNCCLTSYLLFDLLIVVWPHNWCLTRSGLEPTIYRTQDEHANHYTTNAVYWLHGAYAQPINLIVNWVHFIYLRNSTSNHNVDRSRSGRDRMGIGFTTTYAISAYYNWRCEFEPRSWRGVLDTTLCDKVCQSLATGRWFSPSTPVSSTKKTDRHDITEILLKVTLKNIT